MYYLESSSDESHALFLSAANFMLFAWLRAYIQVVFVGCGGGEGGGGGGGGMTLIVL